MDSKTEPQQVHNFAPFEPPRPKAIKSVISHLILQKRPIPLVDFHRISHSSLMVFFAVKIFVDWLTDVDSVRGGVRFRRGFMCNYCMQHAAITCWTTCNCFRVLHAIISHETTALVRIAVGLVWCHWYDVAAAHKDTVIQ